MKMFFRWKCGYAFMGAEYTSVQILFPEFWESCPEMRSGKPSEEGILRPDRVAFSIGEYSVEVSIPEFVFGNVPTKDIKRAIGVKRYNQAAGFALRSVFGGNLSNPGYLISIVSGTLSLDDVITEVFLEHPKNREEFLEPVKTAFSAEFESARPALEDYRTNFVQTGMTQDHLDVRVKRGIFQAHGFVSPYGKWPWGDPFVAVASYKGVEAVSLTEDFVDLPGLAQHIKLKKGERNRGNVSGESLREVVERLNSVLVSGRELDQCRAAEERRRYHAGGT